MSFGCVVPLHKWSHSTKPLCPTTDPVWLNEPVSHQLSYIFNQHAYSFGARCLPRALPCVDNHEFPWVFSWGGPTSLVHPWCQGKISPLIGHAPKLPHPCPNATHVFIVHHNERRVCDPLGSARHHCAPAHKHNTISFPIDHHIYKP